MQPGYKESFFCRVYGPGQNTQGTPTTYYTKVRFDPVKLVIIIDDDTFAITNGHTWDNGKETHSVCNFGTASDCAALKSVGGRANINLTKTKLAVKPGQFKLDGWEANGNTQFSNQCQVVDLVGGGFCGSNQPETNEIQLEVVGSEWQPFGISNEE